MKRPGVVTTARYCAKCGGELTSRIYEDGVGVFYETCDCPSCGSTWHIQQYLSGEVRIFEGTADDGSPEEMIARE